MKKIISSALMILSSCSSSSEFYEFSTQNRPVDGYNRNEIFENYIVNNDENTSFTGYLGEKLQNRTVWNAENMNFRSMYPYFHVELITFNQLSNPQNFSWQERLLFSDALELVTLAINHPMFLDEMRKLTFYDNSRTIVIPSDVIVQDIRDAQLQFIIGKATLDYNVLAEATIGGLSSIIWFRDDIDYQKESIIFLAIILAHELTHNLGYRHVSNVPYGIHEPVYNVLINTDLIDSVNFVKSTPFFEDDFLYRIRNIGGTRAYSSSHDYDVEIDYKHNFEILK